MTPSQLRTFVEVAATGSVRQAAERLFVTPSAVSAALSALQKELDVALVQRDGRGLVVTESGEILAGYARRVLGLLDEAVAAIAGQDDAEGGRVRIVAVTTVGEHVLPPLLASFRARYPRVEISLEVGNRARVWDLLDNHEVDIAIGGRPPATRRFRTLATRPNMLVVVTAPPPGAIERRLSRTVSVAELERSTWLLREPGSGTRSTALELFEELHITPTTLTLGSNGAIRSSALVGLGVTLISRDAVTRELNSGELEEWETAGGRLHRAWHLVARTDGDLPAPAQLFLDHLTTATRAGHRFERIVEEGGPCSRRFAAGSALPI